MKTRRTSVCGSLGMENSKFAGMRNDLAQAGGGNTSVKLDDQIMLVKSSGFQLADVEENSGYSKIDYRLIVDYLKENI